MCWCSGQVPIKIKQKFCEYLKSKYQIKSIFNTTIKSSMLNYIGIKLKDIEFINDDNNELYTFINDTCEIGPNYTISIEELFDQFIIWKKNKMKNNKNTLIKPIHKKNLRNYLSTRFCYGGYACRNINKSNSKRN